MAPSSGGQVRVGGATPRAKSCRKIFLVWIGLDWSGLLGITLDRQRVGARNEAKLTNSPTECGVHRPRGSWSRYSVTTVANTGDSGFGAVTLKLQSRCGALLFTFQAATFNWQQPTGGTHPVQAVPPSQPLVPLIFSGFPGRPKGRPKRSGPSQNRRRTHLTGDHCPSSPPSVAVLLRRVERVERVETPARLPSPRPHCEKRPFRPYRPCQANRTKGFVGFCKAYRDGCFSASKSGFGPMPMGFGTGATA